MNMQDQNIEYILIWWSLASFNDSNFAMILANRSVILLKIKEFKWAVQDLTLAIKTEKYPSENRYKLHQRLSKAYEYLENYESAEEEYRNVLKTLDSGKLTKNQKIAWKT